MEQRESRSNQVSNCDQAIIRRTCWKTKLILLSGSLVLSLIVIEIVLRLAGHSSSVFLQTDPIIGSVLRPNTSYYYAREGHAHVKINSDGLRDVEHSLAKPSDCIRIAVLGDSFTLARQVELEDCFPKVLERLLNDASADGDQRFEVLNFGVPGYETTRELLTLRHKVWKYDPDFVLLAFCENDVKSNSRKLWGHQPIPFFYYDQHGNLQLDNSFRDDPHWLRKRESEKRAAAKWIGSLRIVQLFNAAKNSLDQTRDTPVDDSPGPERGTTLSVYKEPEDDTWREAWQITEELLTMMHNEVHQHGIPLIVVTVCEGIQVRPDREAREAFRLRHGLKDMFYVERRIENLCKREGIPVLALGPKQLEYAERHHAFLHGFSNTRMGNGHWNEEGHRVAAELIAEKFQTMLSQPSASSMADSNERRRR